MATSSNLDSTRNEQKRIRQQIAQIKQQLKRVESLPGTQPWVSFERAQTIQELKSSFPTLKDALRHDLLILRLKLRYLNSKARILEANKAKQVFDKEVDEKLKDAEKKGVLSEKVIADLLSKAESVLRKFVDILITNPTEENIGNVLVNLEQLVLLGSSADGGAAGEAFRAIARASETIVDQKEKTFRKIPTVDNFDKLLESKKNAKLVGGNPQVQPTGYKPANTFHRVNPRESLSEIARRYYGNSSYWDVIYLENFDIIGNNPDRPPVGITLKIP